MVPFSHMWPWQFKLAIINQTINSGLQVHGPHGSCWVGLCGLWLFHLTRQISAISLTTERCSVQCWLTQLLHINERTCLKPGCFHLPHSQSKCLHGIQSLILLKMWTSRARPIWQLFTDIPYGQKPRIASVIPVTKVSSGECLLLSHPDPHEAILSFEIEIIP